MGVTRRQRMSRDASHVCFLRAIAGGPRYCDKHISGGTIADHCPRSCGVCNPNDVAKIDEEHSGTSHYVQPSKGRLVMFSSGMENLHQVKQVTSGTRYVMSMWFTCNADRVFRNFLDGKKADTFQSEPKSAEDKTFRKKRKTKKKKKKKRKTKQSKSTEQKPEL